MGLGSAFKGLFGRKSRRTVAPVTLTLHSASDEQAAVPSSPSGKLPRFRAMATDQLDRKQVDRFSEVRMKLRSAFTPSQPVMDQRMFAGRSELLNAMIRSIEDQRLHLVLYGERGIGKTSLLHFLADAAGEARYIVAYLSCGTASQFQETFRGAAEEVPVLFHSGFAPTESDAEQGATLANLLPPGNFTPRQFAEVCGKLTGTRVLIILDEFDRAESMSFRRDVSELMKFLSDRAMRVQIVIAGVAADLAELLEYTPSIRRNLLALRVPLMNDAEIQTLVSNGERASGMVFERPARDLIVAVAHGSPYLASLTCHHAGLVALDDGRSVVRPAEVVAALDRGMQEIESRLTRPALQEMQQLLSRGLGPQLAAISGVSLRLGGEFDLEDLKAEVGEAEFPGCRRLVEELVRDKVLIEYVDDKYRQGYNFMEEGGRQYLWYRGAQEQAKALTAPARRAAASNA